MNNDDLFMDSLAYMADDLESRINKAAEDLVFKDLHNDPISASTTDKEIDITDEAKIVEPLKLEHKP